MSLDISRPPEDQLTWFVAVVAPSCERIVKDLLSAKGYETFVPTYVKPYTIRGHRKAIRLPLFPRYVLCRVTHEVWSNVIGTPKVQKVLGLLNGVGTIPAHEIYWIRKLVDHGVVGVGPTQTGRRVVVLSGPLEGLTGTVLYSRSSGHVIVSMAFLEKGIQVALDSRYLAPALNPLADSSHRTWS